MRAFIVANGELGDYDFARTVLVDGDYILACDGGLHHCHAMDVLPDYIVGDMDSVDRSLLDKYKDVPTMRFVPEKDQTDLELAIIRACELQVDSIVILGGLGKRIDHQLGNIHALAQAVRHNVQAEIWDENARLILIKDFCRLQASEGRLVTLLPLTTAVYGVITKGLKYALEDEVLEVGYARGLSNEIEGSAADISVKEGLLLVIQNKGLSR